MTFTETGRELSRDIHGSINEVRAGADLPSLRWDDTLAAAAAAHSRSMAEQEFFSHHSPIAGLSSPADRVKAAGGQFDGVGENIAMSDGSHATAARFVEQWMKSPGHRDNLLTPDWELSGVGVHQGVSGVVFATQLFAVAPKVILNEPCLEAQASTWYELHLTVKVGRGYAAAAFVRNRFVASASADRSGAALLKVDVPSEPGRHHVGIGRRKRESGDGWIGVYEGTAEVRAGNTATWHAGPPAHSGCTVLEEALYHIRGSDLKLGLSGRAVVAAICVVDGSVQSELKRGESFQSLLSFRSGTGNHVIDLGIPSHGSQYQIYRRYELDADAGRLQTVSP